MKQERDEDGFEARNFRFVYVDNPTLLNEVIIGRFTLKHLIGFTIASFFLVIALRTNHPLAISMGALALLITVISIIYPKKALSFESLIVGLMYYIIDRLTQESAKEKRIATVSRTDLSSRKESVELPIRVNVNPEDLIQEETMDVWEYIHTVGFKTKQKLREKRLKKYEREL